MSESDFFVKLNLYKVMNYMGDELNFEEEGTLLWKKQNVSIFLKWIQNR